MKRIRFILSIVSNFIWLFILSGVVYTILYYSNNPIAGISFPIDTSFLDAYFYLLMVMVLFSNIYLYYGKIEHLSYFRKILFIVTSILPIITLSLGWLFNTGNGWYWTYIDYFGLFESGILNDYQLTLLLFVIGEILLAVVNANLKLRKQRLDN